MTAAVVTNIVLSTVVFAAVIGLLVRSIAIQHRGHIATPAGERRIVSRRARARAMRTAVAQSVRFES
jgi:hypothetical protein